GCDGNFVLTADGSIVEAQVTAEGECYDEEGLLRLLRLARIGCSEIFQAQLRAAGRRGRSATGSSLRLTMPGSWGKLRRSSRRLESHASALMRLAFPNHTEPASLS